MTPDSVPDSLETIWRAVRRHKDFALVCVVVLASTLASRIVAGQQVEAGANDQSGFSVRKEAQNVGDALADFERYRDKKQWEKAFAAMGKVFDAESEGLVPDKDGLFVQAELKIRAELMSVPPEGREAYRLFNDPKAQQLLNAALDSAADSSGKGASSQAHADDLTALRKLVDKYFITSVGDKAADRLGDALFEAGEFDSAERCWRMIVEDYPDTGLSAALLQTKRAIALARAGRWAKFEEVRSLVRERFAGQIVQIGGKDLEAARFLDDLGNTAPAAIESSATTAEVKPSTMIQSGSNNQPMALPASDTPVWQLPLMDQASCDRINQQLAQIGWGGMASELTDIVPSTAADEKRVYANWMGSVFSLDLVTGKMLWRTDRFFDLSQNVQQMVMQGQSTGMSEGTIEVVGDRLLVIKAQQPDPRRAMVTSTRLMCIAADTGKTIWTSERQGTGVLANWSFVGKPLVDGDVTYVCAFAQQSPTMSLMCIGVADGDLRWRVELGNATGTPDFRGIAHYAAPSLLVHDGKIYVLTNDGALLAVDALSRQIDWAFSYGGHVEVAQQPFFNPFMARANAAAPSGAMFLNGSTLYFKETGGELLYAIDLSGPQLMWKRPIDATVGLAAGDDRSLFLVGSEVDCINIDSRAMLWSDGLSLRSGNILPLLWANRLYAFDDHGVHEVRTDTGDMAPVFRGYDRDGQGGNLSRTADRLITISTRAITAYDLGRSGQH